MENRNITTKIMVCSYEELTEAEKKLIDAAKEASNRSYAPYSRFQVGAAVRLAGGVLVSGSNQENAAYPSGTCAERTTLFYANSQYPDRAVEALAIAAQTGGKFIEHPTAPCGACRQFLAEFSQTMEVLCAKAGGRYVSYRLNQLLPHTFNY